MKKYNRTRTCEKCGYGGIEDVHKKRYEADGSMKKMGEAFGFDTSPTPEHIARTCKNCGYSWQEKPVAKKEHNHVEDLFVYVRTHKPLLKDILPGRISTLTERTPVKQYYMVHRKDGGKPPEKMHDSLFEAHMEAKRLAGKYSGVEFFIVASVDVVKTEAPVIEVGDVVENKACSFCMREPGIECAILKIKDKEVRLGRLDDCCACWDNIPALAIIRKGPEVHTFKDVAIEVIGTHRGRPAIGPNERDGFYLALAGNGKTYDLTLTERKAR